MANTLLTYVVITREALRITHNNIVFAKGVNRQYSKEFAQTGAKVGQSINIRKPNKYYLRRGTAIQIQGTNEQYVPLTLTTQYGVDTEFSSQDLTLSLDDFGKRVLTPKMARISSGIDYDGLQLVQQTFNSVGTPGTTPGTSTGSNFANANAPQIYLNAGVMLDNYACPRDENRRVILNPIAQATSVQGLSGLFQDAGSIAEQYRKGVMGSALGFEFAMDQNVGLQTTGSRTTASMLGGNQAGSSITITGCGNAGTVYIGEVFTIGTTTTIVYSVNPENLNSTGVAAYFTVLPPANGALYYVADSGGNIPNLLISPPIVGPSTPVNPLQTVGALPVSGAAVTWQGNANSTSYVNNVAYHQDAFTFATADLIMPGGVDFVAREVYDGISMRIIRAYDITNDLLPDRIDVLGGWAALRPEFGVRIWG